MQSLREDIGETEFATIAARFALDSVAEAFRTMEAGSAGKVVVLPQR